MPPLLFPVIGRMSADIGQCRDQFQWVGNGRKCGSSRWNFAAISFCSWVKTISDLDAAIAISGYRSFVGLHRTMLAISPACWAWWKMSSIRWNLADISCRSRVITTSGLWAAITISGCRLNVGRHRTMLELAHRVGRGRKCLVSVEISPISHTVPE